MEREWRRYDQDSKRRLRTLRTGAPPRICRRIEELALTFDVRELPPDGDTAAALLALAVSVSAALATPDEVRRLFDQLLEA